METSSPIQMTANYHPYPEIDLHYQDWPLDLLMDYIVNKHHAYVRKTLPHLLDLSAKQVSAFGLSHRELHQVNQLLNKISIELTMHLEREEVVLFPLIHQLLAIEAIGGPLVSHPRSCLRNPVATMEGDHGLIVHFFEEIARLTNHYEIPADADDSYAVFYTYLQELESDLEQHVHLENDILFPKAISLEEKYL